MTAKTVPQFESEAEEREFWDTHNVTDFVDSEEWKPNKAQRGETTTFAIRLNIDDLEKIRELAESRGIGPTQLARSWMLDRIRLEEAAGELANPDADEQELQIRRAVMDDVSANLAGIVLAAIGAFKLGEVAGKKISETKRKRAAAQTSKTQSSSTKGSSKNVSVDRRTASG